MDSDSSDSDEPTHNLTPKSPDDDGGGSPGELNSPPDSEDSNSVDGSPIASPAASPAAARNSSRGASPIHSSIHSPIGDSLDRSPLASPASDHKSKSSKHSDNDGELSDSSSSSHTSSSSSRSGRRVSTEASGDVNQDVVTLQSPTTPEKAPFKPEIVSHGEDLSDVSDLDSNDDGSIELSDEEIEPPKKEKPIEKPAPPPPPQKKDTTIVLPSVDEVEQLDFEAEEPLQEKEDKEEGECEGKEDKSDNEGEIDGDDEGELKGDDLEEGEVTDDEDNRPEETEPRPVCRFYNRGQCTWGASCRFLHPGVTDKGNYTMFDMVRPLVPANGPSMYPAIDYRAAYDKPMGAPGYMGGRKDEPAIVESAWERGLRQAKEMMRKSTKRKETDMDFEEKKMNLSIGQEELDKENDYYTRPASPIISDEADRWGPRMKSLEPEGKYREATAGPRYDDYAEAPPAAYYPVSRGRQPWPGAGEYSRRVHYDPGERPIRTMEGEFGGGRGKYRSGAGPHRVPDFYDGYDEDRAGPTPGGKRPRKHPTREVMVQRVIDKPWREERYVEEVPPSKHRGGRGDEWADPWMRSKSPTSARKNATRPARRQSYSSGSSYGSSSSTRSGSSASSYSSYSHPSRSRSKSRSGSGSRSPAIPRAARRKPSAAGPSSAGRAGKNAPAAYAHPQQRGKGGKPGPQEQGRMAGKQGKAASMSLITERKAASERLLCMNPPAPSPRKAAQRETAARPPSPGMMRKSAQNPPPPAAVPQPSRPPGPSRAAAVAAVSDRAKAAGKPPGRARPSRSSSGSDSSGSSSDSSESSYSSSSSSPEPQPKAVRPQKRIMIDERERLALAQKVKAMDALKLSGQKPQIKLTLKTPGANPPAPTKRLGATGLPELPELNLVRRDRLAPTVLGKKRPNDGPLEVESLLASKVAALTGTKPSNKKATSRREELLKQLKAVEDAIARKRSKN